MKTYLFLPLLIPAISLADNKIKVADYSTKGVVSLSSAVNYIIDYHDIPLSELRPAPNQEPTLASKLEHSTVSGDLWFIKKLAGPGKENGPFTEAQVTAVLPPGKSSSARYKELPSWQKKPPLTTPLLKQKQTYLNKETHTTTERTFSGTAQDVREQRAAASEDPALKGTKEVPPWSTTSYGPLRLRRDVDSVFSYAFDDDGLEALYGVETAGESPGLIKAKGARFSFSNDRLDPNGQTWSTQGALLFPIHHYREPDAGSAFTFHSAIAASWNVESKEGPDPTEVNELKLSAPLVWGKSGLGYFQLSPFYQTDTDFEGEFYGATASFSLVAEPCFGFYRKITDVGSRELNMSIKLNAILNYSEVGKASPYSNRMENDDWLRAGGEAGLEFGLFDPKGKRAPITASVSYTYLGEIEGNGGDGDLFKASLSYWLTNNAGISLEYENGETPVADKRVDLLTVGLEFRY